MNDEKRPNMRDCLFEAQDNFQSAKRRMEKTTKCISDGLRVEGLTLEQTSCILEAVADCKVCETLLAETHVKLQDYFAKVDEALAGEATRRR